MKIKTWDELVSEFGLYKEHIDSDILVSYGLYEYTLKHLDELKTADKFNIDEYLIRFGDIDWIIPKEYFRR